MSKRKSTKGKTVEELIEQRISEALQDGYFLDDFIQEQMYECNDVIAEAVEAKMRAPAFVQAVDKAIDKQLSTKNLDKTVKEVIANSMFGRGRGL